MKNKTIRIAALICFALANAASAADFKIQRIDAGTLKFEGEIDKESAAALSKALDERVTLLRVTSPGGDMWEAIQIGKYIHDRRITVEVESECASSCANYWFLGAVSKRLLPGAVLGFHGDMIGKMSSEKQAALRRLGEPREQIVTDTADATEVIEVNQRLELAFRDRVGLGQDFYVYAGDRVEELWNKLGRKREEPTGEIVLTTADGVKRFPISELDTAMQLVDELSRKKVQFTMNMKASANNGYRDIIYFPSRATLERFGIRGITDYPYPASQAELRETKLMKNATKLHAFGDFKDG